jgi:hypothetical protein
LTRRRQAGWVFNSLKYSALEGGGGLHFGRADVEGHLDLFFLEAALLVKRDILFGAVQNDFVAAPLNRNPLQLIDDSRTGGGGYDEGAGQVPLAEILPANGAIDNDVLDMSDLRASNEIEGADSAEVPCEFHVEEETSCRYDAAGFSVFDDDDDFRPGGLDFLQVRFVREHLHDALQQPCKRSGAHRTTSVS